MPNDFKSFEIDNDYRWTILVVLIMCAHYWLLIGSIQLSRRKFFTQGWMDEHFGEKHEAQTGTKIQKLGLPDHGGGRYAMSLPYADWMDFMKA